MLLSELLTDRPVPADEALDEDGESDGEDGEADGELVEEGEGREHLPGGEDPGLQAAVQTYADH